jgi:hypothetical protein
MRYTCPTSSSRLDHSSESTCRRPFPKNSAQCLSTLDPNKALEAAFLLISEAA